MNSSQLLHTKLMSISASSVQSLPLGSGSSTAYTKRTCICAIVPELGQEFAAVPADILFARSSPTTFGILLASVLPVDMTRLSCTHFYSKEPECARLYLHLDAESLIKDSLGTWKHRKRRELWDTTYLEHNDVNRGVTTNQPHDKGYVYCPLQSFSG